MKKTIISIIAMFTILSCESGLTNGNPPETPATAVPPLDDGGIETVVTIAAVGYDYASYEKTGYIAYTADSSSSWSCGTISIDEDYVARGFNAVSYGYIEGKNIDMLVIGSIDGNFYYNDGAGWRVERVEGFDCRRLVFGNNCFVALDTANTCVTLEWLSWGEDININGHSGELKAISNTIVDGNTTAVNVVFGNGRFVAVGSNREEGNSSRYYSGDGLNWARANWNSDHNDGDKDYRFSGVAFGKGVFVASTEFYGWTAFSQDGVNWGYVYVGDGTERWTNLSYGEYGEYLVDSGAGIPSVKKEEFIMRSARSSYDGEDIKIAHSDDGYHWSIKSGNEPNPGRAISDGSTWFSTNYTSNIYTSKDGDTWDTVSDIELPPSAPPSAVVHWNAAACGTSSVYP
jgi:hypothetical protein